MQEKDYQIWELYVIIEKEVGLSLGDLSQGDIFGEKAFLLCGQLADVGFNSIQDVEVLRIDIKTLQPSPVNSQK